MSSTPTIRGGNTLVITLLMIVIVVGLVSLASDHLSANRTLAQVDREHQRAQFTAESFIALVERKLYNLAASSTARLKENLQDNPGAWFNLVGFDIGTTGGVDSAIYLDGCALRWRVEPIKIMASTNLAANANEKFFVNSERDPELQFARRQAAGVNLITDEAQHFYFRIAVEAYTLKQAGDRTSIPWRDHATHTAMAQAQRVVQFEDVNAFRYLFNYVANSNTGDLEFSPSAPVTITGGGMRSNQRIFFSAEGASFTIGSAGTAVPVEAANGIFRMNKRDLLAGGATDARSINPTDGSPNDTNGAVTLNGVALESTADTRTSLAGHHDAVRDGSDDRPVQEDLDTYQGWNNGFLAPYWTPGPGTRIYQYADGVYSIRPLDNHYHAGDPPPTDTGLFATGLPLFRFPVSTDPANTQTFADIWPLPQGTAGTAYGLALPADVRDYAAMIDAATGLPRLSWPLPPITDPTLPAPPTTITTPLLDKRGFFTQAIGSNSRGRTGLVIRERGRHLATAQFPTATANPGALDLIALNDWMRANYVVYLGRDGRSGSFETVDITQEFFDYSVLTPPTTVRDLIAHEDVFTNRREQAWFASQGMPGVQANVLTLNLARFAMFLNRQVNPAKLTAGRYYRDYFNDLIYLERTPRPFVDANGPYAHPLIPAAASVPAAIPYPFTVAGLNLNNGVDVLAQPMLSPVIGFVDTGAVAGTVHGTAGTWTVYPHTRGVRLDRATNATNRRMTIITPNTCYLWGDFNTANQTTPIPCAVYADAVIALSNAWSDDNSADPVLPLATNTTYRAAFVTHNVPTDQENAAQGGSGGAHNVMRFLEDWSGSTFSFTGCVVVPGRIRHTRAPINGAGGTVFHREPIYQYTFNDALLTSGGQPPASLKTTQAKRVMSSVVGRRH